jgi:hypothetical protein
LFLPLILCTAPPFIRCRNQFLNNLCLLLEIKTAEMSSKIGVLRDGLSEKKDAQAGLLAGHGIGTRCPEI